jgi:sugar lactone lactonase YvrE
MRIDRLAATPDQLGESPIWEAQSGRLFWVDAVGRRVRALHLASGTEQSWSTPLTVGSIGLAGPGHLLLALPDGFHQLDLQTSAVTPVALLDAPNPRMRLNDGKTDRTGRYICGGMGLHAEPIAALHRLTPPNRLEQLADGIRIGNAICFSPSGDRMYFADSLSRQIMVCDYDREGTSVSAPRLFIDTSPLGSAPDGATVDSAGHLWVALVQAGKIGRISPEGQVVATIDVPVQYPSCPAFGGDDMDILFVTSIKDSGTGRMVSTQENAGAVFAISGLGVRGIAETRFAQKA